MFIELLTDPKAACKTGTQVMVISTDYMTAVKFEMADFEYSVQCNY
jgi:hypothetical protein